MSRDWQWKPKHKPRNPSDPREIRNPDSMRVRLTNDDYDMAMNHQRFSDHRQEMIENIAADYINRDGVDHEQALEYANSLRYNDLKQEMEQIEQLNNVQEEEPPQESFHFDDDIIDE